MPERSNEVGFTEKDREVLITVKVKMERLEIDVSDGLRRIAGLEADRVRRKDLEDLLDVIETKTQENTAYEGRLAELEKLIPKVDFLQRVVWICFGGGAVLWAVTKIVFKW